MRDGDNLISKITGGDADQRDRRVVVIGAGAVGVEFAGEIKNYYPNISVTLVHSRAEVLSSEPLPTEVKDKAKVLLEEEGVDLVLGNRATYEQLPSGKYQVTLANNTIISADLVLDTTKKGEPTTGFLPPKCLDEEKEIKVTSNLTFKPEIPNAQCHFGVGDVIAWSGIKRAGGAMVMGQVAAANVYASILNSEDDANDLKLSELPHYNNVIGLAVGKQCLTYDKDNGIKFGVQLMKDYFQDDLGWKANLKYLQLTDAEVAGVENEKAPEKVHIGEVGVEAVTAAA
jgi:NADH dehydrogenase FAD-containing subunit